jgi:UDP-N-acetylmuramate dehydrogenase
MVIGKGTNVLISDKGIRGVVIDLSKGFSDIQFDGDQCNVGVGVQVPKLVMECEKRGLGGLELFAGIPGSVGGAMKMNAGCLGREFYQFIEHIDVIDKGELRTILKNDLVYHYRHVPIFDDPEVIAVSAQMSFTPADPRTLETIRKESLEKRKRSQPISQPSCGSVFKNPPGDFAGRLIESCGLKGFRHGGASVSTVHSNFIVNDGQAAAADVLAVMKEIQQTVKIKFNVSLEPEVRLYGFEKNELSGLLNQ